MANAQDGDDLARLFDLIHDNVVPDDQTPDGIVYVLREAPTEPRMLTDRLDAVEQILDNPRGSGRIFFRDEVEQLGGPIQSGFGPEDAEAHLA
jgi:hypothetical protein